MDEHTLRQSRPEGPRNVQFKISLTRSEIAYIEEISKRLHMTKSEMLRIALADFIDHQERLI